MNLLKEGKTNWKYILIVVILAVIVGGGILGYWQLTKVREIKVLEIKAPKMEEPEMKIPEGIVEKIIDELLPSNVDEREEIKHYITGLNGDKLPETIIIALGFPEEELSYEEALYYEIEGLWLGRAYLLVVTILNEKGDYEKFADFHFYIPLHTATPTVKKIRDLTNDGIKEISLEWQKSALRGGNIANEIFLTLDWSAGKIDELKIRDKEGIISSAIFDTGMGWFSGLTVFEFHSVKIADINKNGKFEIIEFKEKGKWLEGKAEVEEWEALVYEWDGSLFSYSSKLSSSGFGSGPGWEFLE